VAYQEANGGEKRKPRGTKKEGRKEKRHSTRSEIIRGKEKSNSGKRTDKDNRQKGKGEQERKTETKKEQLSDVIFLGKRNKARGGCGKVREGRACIVAIVKRRKRTRLKRVQKDGALPRKKRGGNIPKHGVGRRERKRRFKSATPKKGQVKVNSERGKKGSSNSPQTPKNLPGGKKR